MIIRATLESSIILPCFVIGTEDIIPCIGLLFDNVTYYRGTEI
jgi:hypothetical protein